MEKKKSVHTDEGLQGNETIEEAILVLQQEPTEEMLAHTLTAPADETLYYIKRHSPYPVAPTWNLHGSSDLHFFLLYPLLLSAPNLYVSI